MPAGSFRYRKLPIRGRSDKARKCKAIVLLRPGIDGLQQVRPFFEHAASAILIIGRFNHDFERAGNIDATDGN